MADQADAPARLLELAHDAILVRDPATSALRFWNRGAEVLYGWRRAQALGQVSHALLRAEFPRPLAEIERELAETGGWEGELVHTTRDGRRVVVLSRWALDRDAEGAPRACLEINRDITRRRRLEERQRFLVAASQALAASLDQETTLGQVARLAIPLLADFVAVDLVDGAGQVRRAAMAHRDPEREAMVQEMNRRFPLALQRETLVTRAIRAGAPDLAPAVDDDLLVALAEDAAHLGLWRALGLRSLLVVPLLAGGKALGGIVFAYSDSGRRYGPEDQAFAEDLAARCAMAMENARLYGEAQEAIRARDAFLASAAHDLRGPLGAITGFAQLLRQRASATASLPSAELARYLEPIERGAARLAGQVQELRDLARLQDGETLELRRRPTDLVALARLVTAEQGRAAAGHALRVEAAEAALIGDWDESRLYRALTNLVANAIAYSPAGGPVTVALARESAEAGAWAVARVTDGGIGVPADELPRLFERFYRGRNARALREGTGVGLTSVREVAAQHGGTITAASVEGEGSTFTLRLPLGP